jgi:ferredoxin
MGIKSWFIKPSTEAWLKEARKTPNYSFFDFLHGYIYGRWPYFYIGVGVGEHPLAKKLAPLAGWVEKQITKGKKQAGETEAVSMADTYHGKAVPIETVKQLVLVNEEIRVPDLEQVIPYKRARAIILKNPDHIALLDCPCRSAREHPCLPLDVCLVVGEPFASFVIEHNPAKARWITQQQAVEVLEAENRRGHVHHVFFKDAMLERYYAICNCCSCCCGAMQAQRNGTPMLCSSGYVAQVDEDLCMDCAECVDTCQFGALSLLGTMYNTVDVEKCMGCGVCVDKCQMGAISLKRDASKGEPLEILALMEKAAG